MSETHPTLGLVVHEANVNAKKVVEDLTATASARGLVTLPVARRGPLPAGVDVLVGVGGDGTLLAAAALALEADIPIVGVNLGHVGYLAEVDPGNIGTMLDGIKDRSLEEISRMTVEADTGSGERWTGVNEVVVEKLEPRRLVHLHVEINGHFFATYRADGIITATPLGSTAYSLSAGGPVLDPALDAMIITPVAPHSLLSRSIVLRPDAEVRYTVALERPVRLNVDGREAGVLAEGDQVVVRAGRTRIRFLSLGAHPFPQAVRVQFGLDHA